MLVNYREIMPIRRDVPLDFESFKGRNLEFVAPKYHPTLALAFDLMIQAHAGQFRETGEEYAVHPIRVAENLLRMGFRDPIIIIGAFHHDVKEDAEHILRPWLIQTLEQAGPKLFNVRNRSVANMYEKLFGGYPYRIMEALSKVEPEDNSTESKIRAESRTLDKIYRGPYEGWLIKLSDRLDNMETLPLHPDDPSLLERDLARIRKKVLETCEGYRPIFEDAVAVFPQAKPLLVALDKRCAQLAAIAE
jgi:GTP diphosphokinase / guanosine-3',5'-bis(diphosphate) 3'-diphosphatase